MRRIGVVTMSRLRAVGLSIWDFLVGDDWRTALGVAIALCVTAILAGLDVAAWWATPLAVGLLLWLSVRRVARQR